MAEKKHLIVIGGATATGKTTLSIQLAQHFDAEILSCDSRQFYREMTIGTAKPDEEELNQATHHFVNSLSIEQDYSVGDYEKDAIALLEKLFEEKDIAIMVGGSGLFIRAICEGLDEFPDVPKAIREDLEALFQKEGIEALQKELKVFDPVYYDKVDLQNAHRLMRAIGVCRASGKAFSSFHNQTKKTRNFEPIYIQTTMERSLLYDKINLRVDKMMEAGLLEEAKSLYPFKHLNALQTVGYQEFFDHFDGKTTLEEAIELVKRNSRRYAKRQMTWFRKNDYWKLAESKNHEEVVKYIESVIKHQTTIIYK